MKIESNEKKNLWHGELFSKIHATTDRHHQADHKINNQTKRMEMGKRIFNITQRHKNVGDTSHSPVIMRLKSKY